MGSVLVLAVATGCSSGTGAADPVGSTSAAPTASASPSASGYPVTFDATLRSAYSKTNKVNKSGDSQYGLNVLEGYTKVSNTNVRVRMLASLDYTDGSGPVGGFLELVWSDGTVLGMRQDGTATTSGSTTNIDANLAVIGGSGRAQGTTGTGKLTGTRKTSSTTMTIDVTLDLVNAPEFITGDPESRGTQTPKESYAATIAP